MEDSRIRAAILAACTERGADASVCPSEVARLLAPLDWRALMAPVRAAGAALAKQGSIRITQRGVAVDLDHMRGAIRFSLPAIAAPLRDPRPGERELPVRVIVIEPPPGVAFAMQRGKDALLAPSKIDATSRVFEFCLRIALRKTGSRAPNVLGPYAHGTPAQRFLYVNSGTLAGQRDSVWTRRAKIMTAGITWPRVEETLVTPGGVLEVRIDGRAKDGGPCCATVPLLGDAWTVGAATYPGRRA